ncbi:probable LRR receptor-like serine/threonine-protein kinase At3g47570 [Pyrus communis]|uniref:probable LRR receptor-like serine/threonine-protein kinase At3g47570 n=1 Tax=Pyrus communis TaxID=23211 RepID=UPI0035C07B94
MWGLLPNLEKFSGGVNKFTRSIPVSLSNASKLRILDFAENGLTGKLPGESFGSLRSLFKLNFDDNRLGSGKTGDLNSLSFLANCTNLEVLGFSRNRFGGELPESIANLSTKLRIFTMGGNLIRGSIPIGIANLVNLINLGMEQNYLSGSVPDVIGKLQKLQGLYLELNQFSGTIPSTLCNLTSVTRLFMEWNRFEGSFTPSLGNCQNLLLLNLSSNQLSGTIPKEVIGLSSLSIYLSMSTNSLTGSLPSEVDESVHLSELDVSGNKLSGEIPVTLGSCACLVSLHLKGNQFEGTIPLSLANLRGLEEIDISRNNLSGQIPKFLGKLRALKQLNVSHNEFEGELPKEGFFSNASGVSILGSFGSFYKGVISGDGTIVVVTVLNLQQPGAFKIFIDECKALRNHLHHHCETSIVHCDLKPNNVLLDQDMVAHVGDFGLTRFLLESSNVPSQSQAMSMGLKGSVGYIPPKMFTGKRPTDDMFRDGISIHQFTAMALPDHVIDIVDPSLLLERDDVEADDSRYRDDIQERRITRHQDRNLVQARQLEECLVSVVRIGLSCSAISRRERMHMDVVVNKMKTIRDSYLGLRRRRS